MLARKLDSHVNFRITSRVQITAEKELLVDEALEQICEQSGKGLSLKAEQKDAIHSLLLGRIVLVVLPKGFAW